jgi:biopolymer transport protein ExbB
MELALLASVSAGVLALYAGPAQAEALAPAETGLGTVDVEAAPPERAALGPLRDGVDEEASRPEGPAIGDAAEAAAAAALPLAPDPAPALPDVAAGRPAWPVPVAIERRLQQGGWVMVGLLGCSLLVVALAVERWLATRRMLVWPAPLRALVDHADGVDRDALRVQVKSGDSVGARLVRAGLRAEENGTVDAAGVVAEIGLREVARLRTGLPMLATLANLATMLGLFGTVLGMIDAFEQIASMGSGDPRIVAGGIFKALITTAAGLGIGIAALAIHAGLAARVDTRVRELEDGLGALFDPSAAPPPARAPIAS